MPDSERRSPWRYAMSMPAPVKVYAGVSIGQLVFYTTERAIYLYFKKGNANYLDQRQATSCSTLKTEKP
jgi:dCTP deaminase